jgi:serine/threonine protein kinase
MSLTPGTRLGVYEIVAPVGAGGMGEVYRARDPRLSREVAIKILPKGDADPERQRRFALEARAAGSLNHPNILAVYDVGTDADTPYIISELVEGEPVRGEMQRGPLPIKRVLDLATQIADGLAAAHEAGVVHRDLKPENLMVTRAGRVKILDFGLAKEVRATAREGVSLSPTMTVPGLILGTVPYMSPEQARGVEVDFRSDQFSLGLILYEMAAGRPAFQRDNPVQTLAAIIGEEAPPVTSFNPAVPVPLRWIIDRCLAKDSRERYGSTIDLFHDLRTARDRLTESAVSEPTRVDRRRTWKARLATAVAAVLAVIAGVLIWTAARSTTVADLLRIG